MCHRFLNSKPSRRVTYLSKDKDDSFSVYEWNTKLNLKQVNPENERPFTKILFKNNFSTLFRFKLELDLTNDKYVFVRLLSFQTSSELSMEYDEFFSMLV